MCTRFYLPEIGSFELTDTALAGEVRFGTGVIDEHSVQFDASSTRKTLLGSFEHLEIHTRAHPRFKTVMSLQCVHRRYQGQ